MMVHLTKCISKRHLLVIDKKSGEVVVEQLFQRGENILPTPLNFGIEFEKDNVENDYTILREQWTGKLFKNKPLVVFGFEWSPYCPAITFLSQTEKSIWINCDSRH